MMVDLVKLAWMFCISMLVATVIASVLAIVRHRYNIKHNNNQQPEKSGTHYS